MVSFEVEKKNLPFENPHPLSISLVEADGEVQIAQRRKATKWHTLETDVSPSYLMHYSTLVCLHSTPIQALFLLCTPSDGLCFLDSPSTHSPGSLDFCESSAI